MNAMQLDPLWAAIQQEAEQAAQAEPLLADFLHSAILQHDSLAQALACHLANKLASTMLSANSLRQLFGEVLEADASIVTGVRADLQACRERDPASENYSTPLLYFKGFHAIQSQRITHYLWQQQRKTLALFLQNRISEVTAADIHPAAQIGHGVMLDHGTCVVVGETAVIGHNVSLLQGVTLGGTGKQHGDRHPKVGNGVLIGANSCILGNIHIGECAKVGAGSVVLDDVPAHCTVVGVPAKVVARACKGTPALEMDQKV
ncbi:serine O-acetyltransferase [Neisseriaceae bacterium TC5R-5]|nr:serine O-acetyltransferase [Neisseriaceae bacterium TC5R-5]